MRLYFSWRVSLIGFLLAALFLRLAWWQWERHLFKQQMIVELKQRVLAEPLELSKLLTREEDLAFRLAHVKGAYDFQHEVVLRNRVLHGVPGVLVLTPLKLNDQDRRLLINRGFLPLAVASADKRAAYQKPPEFDGTVLLKAAIARGVFAGADPDSGPPHAWVDQWLRPDLVEMAKQLPYPIFSLYGEVVPDGARATLARQIFSSEGGREEILSLEMRQIQSDESAVDPNVTYPIPQVDTVVPADIHLGYTIQWCFIALLTVLISLIMQRKPARTRERIG